MQKSLGDYMSYTLKCLKGGDKRDYVGEYWRG